MHLCIHTYISGKIVRFSFPSIHILYLVCLLLSQYCVTVKKINENISNESNKKCEKENGFKLYEYHLKKNFQKRDSRESNGEQLTYFANDLVITTT